jgi:hypothetical protein
MSISFQSLFENHLQNVNQINKQRSPEPEIRMAFRLHPITLEAKVGLLQNKEIVFILNQDLIQKAILIGIGSTGAGYELKMIERSFDDQTLYLEDQMGLIRIILKLEKTNGHAIALVNHPSNQYRLEPVLEH